MILWRYIWETILLFQMNNGVVFLMMSRHFIVCRAFQYIALTSGTSFSLVDARIGLIGASPLGLPSSWFWLLMEKWAVGVFFCLYAVLLVINGSDKSSHSAFHYFAGSITYKSSKIFHITCHKACTLQVL